MSAIIDNELLKGALQTVRERMAATLNETSLASVLDPSGLFGNGKMLRARLGLRVGPVCGVSSDILTDAATAVELIHSASLLHDDVIDGGCLRRNAPAFWVERGIPAAILTGDLLFFKAFDLLSKLNISEWSNVMIRLAREVCEAETEQELIWRGKPVDEQQRIDIARRKTGPLFAFMGYVAAGSDPALQEALTECGYRIGTAYQMADDFLDINGQTEEAGKTLGTDQARSKATTISPSSNPIPNPYALIDTLCAESSRLLVSWPDVRCAWDTYLEFDMLPVLRRNANSQPTEAV